MLKAFLKDLEHKLKKVEVVDLNADAEVAANETVIGSLDEELRALFILHRETRINALGAGLVEMHNMLAPLMAGQLKDEEIDALAQSIKHTGEEAALIANLFWFLAREQCNLWIGNIGIRKGWQIVTWK